MKQIVKFISVIFFTYFAFTSIGVVIGFYFTYRHLSETNDYKIVIGYPLFLQVTITVMAAIGLVSSFGLFYLKNWGRYLANIVLASTIILFILRLIEKIYPDYFGYTLMESDGSFIFFHSSFNWEIIVATVFSVVVLYLLNCNNCKKVFSS